MSNTIIKIRNTMKHFSLILKSFLVSSGLLASSYMFSQRNDDTIILKEYVVTSGKVIQSIGNVTQKITLIPEATIESTVSANRNVSEMLQNQPGASVTVLSRNDANWGTWGGIGPKYSTFMLSGIPVDAFIDPMTLDLMAISRIEYQRGPASVMYPAYLSQDFAGAQSPLAGTVNLILKERFEVEKTVFSSSFGSYNTFNTQVFHQGIAGRIHYFAGTQYEMSDYTDYGIENSWLNMKKNPEYNKTKVFGGMSHWSDDGRQKFNVFASKTIHNGDAGRVYRGYDHHYGLINASWELTLNPKLALKASAGFRNYDRSWQESQWNMIDSLISNNGVFQRIVPADVMLSWKHGKNHLLSAGVDYQGAEYYTWSDPLQGYETYGNKSTAMQSGVYAQEELHFGKLIVRGGVRGQYIKNNIALIGGAAPADASPEWSALLYSGGVKYSFNDKYSVFANAGTSFMTPGLKSAGGTIAANDTLSSGQLPNPDLKPESGLGLDFGVNIQPISRFRISLRGFQISVSDAIVENVVRQSPSQSMSVNAGNTSATGAEIEINHRLNNSLQWFANFTYTKTTIENPYDADQDGATVPFSPEMVANAGFSYKLPFGLLMSPSLNYNGGYFDSSSKSGRSEFTPGILLNAYMSMELYREEDKNIVTFIQLHNITNNQYEMPWQFRDPGFSVMAGIKASF